MELIEQDKKVFFKKVGDLVRRIETCIHKRHHFGKGKTGIVLEIRGERICVAHVDGTFCWANDWNYWKIVK